MPNDFITLNALAKELNGAISGGKIDKITMPEADEINIFLRKGGENLILALSANAQNPRVHLTTRKKNAPLVAPAFCMRLRKCLSGGVVNSVSMLGDDRIFDFSFTARNELRDEVTYSLIVETMGRYSNILLVDAGGTIKDTLKQASFDTATKRCLLPSVRYQLPPRNKIPCTDIDAVTTALKNYNGTDLAGFIMSSVSGFSALTVKELLYTAGVDNSQKPTADDVASLSEQLKTFLDVNSSAAFSPCCSLVNGAEDDYFVFPYSSSTLSFSPSPTLSAAVETCIGKKDEICRRNDHTKHLRKAHSAAVSKLRKRLEKCRQRLAEASGLERNRKFGELLTSNLYKISRGDRSVTVQDYYEEGMPEITIPLDEKLSPGQNAQQYFKKYAKQKRTLEVVTAQIKDSEAELQYLLSIEPSIALCSTDDEIAEVENELIAAGALKPSGKRNKTRTKAAEPLFYEKDGFTIAVGKNNLQNDKLTFKVANGGDLWVHAKGVHGSHVIVFAEGRVIPDDVILTACEIACYWSQAQPGTKTVCDYTSRRNLKRHPSGKPGMVLYTTYNSATVTANEHKELLQKD